MDEKGLLSKAQALREQEHHLKPDLRLKTDEEVVEFIHNKGLVSMLGGNELPGLVSALLGKPWKPTGKGFTSWQEWWDLRISGRNAGHTLGDLPRRKDIIGTRIFRNSKTLVSEKLWPVLDPIVRHYEALATKRKILSEPEWKILALLEKNGPTRTDRLRPFLKLEGKQHTSRFHRALAKLENHGLIVGYEDPKPERHLHAAIWHLWHQKIGPSKWKAAGAPYQEAMTRLLERTLSSAVFAPEGQVSKWYPWEGSLEAKERLILKGLAVRTGQFLVASRVALS